MFQAHFFARGLLSKSEPSKGYRRVIWISVTSVSLGMVVMILSLAVVEGFKREMRQTISFYGGDISVTSRELVGEFETKPVRLNSNLLQHLKLTSGLAFAVPFAVKPGVASSGGEFEGIILRGTDSAFRWERFPTPFLSGQPPAFKAGEKSLDVAISSLMASRLKLKTGDKFLTFFVQDPIKIRKFKVAGIYGAGIEEFDKLVYCDIRQVQSLNDWDSTQVSGVDFFATQFDQISDIAAEMKNMAGIFPKEGENLLKVETIWDKYASFFDWISLFDLNALVILILMTAVTVINMVSGLLILILEKARFIGLMKTLGASNSQLRKIFLLKAGYLIIRGMAIGNLVGLGLIFIQKWTGLIKLDPSKYYLSEVALYMEPWTLVVLNLAVFGLTFAVMVLPAMIIAKMEPGVAVKID